MYLIWITGSKLKNFVVYFSSGGLKFSTRIQLQEYTNLVCRLVGFHWRQIRIHRWGWCYHGSRCSSLVRILCVDTPYNQLLWNIWKQKCIPVGCLPPARYRTGGLCLPYRDSPWTETSLDRDPLGQRPPIMWPLVHGGTETPCEQNHRHV